MRFSSTILSLLIFYLSEEISQCNLNLTLWFDLTPKNIQLKVASQNHSNLFIEQSRHFSLCNSPFVHILNWNLRFVKEKIEWNCTLEKWERKREWGNIIYWDCTVRKTQPSSSGNIFMWFECWSKPDSSNILWKWWMMGKHKVNCKKLTKLSSWRTGWPSIFLLHFLSHWQFYYFRPMLTPL